MGLLSKILFRKKSASNQVYLLAFFGVLLLALAPLIYKVSRNPSTADAAWYDEGYTHRQKFSFTHNADLPNPKAITFTLDTAELITDGVMQSDCDDTRFTDINGNPLAYDLTGTCNNASTTYEVIFETVVDGSNIGYVYYGNPSALNAEVDSTVYTALTPSGGDPGAITDRTAEEDGPGPVAYWKFDEGVNDTCANGTDDVCDNTQSGFDGAITGGEWKDESLCLRGKCVLLTDDPIGFGDVAQLDNRDEVTFSFWIKTPDISTEVSNQGKVMQKLGASGQRSYQVTFANSGAVPCNKLSVDCLAIETWRNNGSTRDTKVNIPVSNMEDNRWHFVVFTYSISDDAIIAYLDGKEIDTNTITETTTLPNTTASFCIGASDASCTTGALDSFLDEVKIYPYARSADQIKADFAARGGSQGAGAVLGSSDQSFLSDGLVGYWPMDETSGTTVTDYSGNGENGTLTLGNKSGTATSDVNTTTTVLRDDGGAGLSSTDDVYIDAILYITDDVGCGLSADEQRVITDYDGTNKDITVGIAFSSDLDGCDYTIRQHVGSKFGNGLRMIDTTNNAVTVSDNPFDMGTGNFTLSGWFRLDSLSNPDAPELINKQPSANEGYQLRVAYNDEVEFQIEGTNGNIEVNSDNSAIATDTWYHIVGVYDSKNGSKVYINGEQSGSTVQGNAGNIDNAGNLLLGRGFNSFEMNGLMDEVRIYSRALSPAEVKKLYEWAPGPVGYWNFDENAGSTAYDRANGLNATLNSASYSPGKYGSAGSFTGASGSYANTGSTLVLNGDFTVGFWAKTSTSGSNQVFVGNRGGSDSASGFTIFGNSAGTAMQFDYGDGTSSVTGVNATVDYDDGEWRYYTYVVERTNNNSQRAYINGDLADSNTSAATNPVGSALNIGFGAYANDSFNLNGQIDDVRIYNYARTPSQIVEDMSARGGSALGGNGTQLAYWAFDEGYGTTTLDSINEYSGSFGGATNPSWTTGKIGKALEFTATTGTDGSRVTYTSPTNVDLGTTTGDQLTFTAWIKPDASQTNSKPRIVRNGTGSDENYSIFIDNLSGGTFRIGSEYHDGTAFRTVQTTNNHVNAGEWNHIAAVFTQGTDIKFFVNGILAESVVWANNNSVVPSTSFNIGGHTGGTAQSFDGLIDEVKIYSSALTDEQVLIDMNANAGINFGTGGSAESANLTDGAVPDPVGYWDFNEKTGTTANDKSGNGNTGTLTNMDRDDWVKGKYGGGLDFDGSNDTVNAGSDSSLDNIFDSGGTIAGWVRPRSDGGGSLGRIMEKGSQVWFAATVDENTNADLQFRYTFDGAQGRWSTTTDPLILNTWNHVVIVYNSDSAANDPTFYINGVAYTPTEQDTPSGTRNSEASTTLRIGNAIGQTSGIDGYLDDIKVWSQTLTASQVAYEYNRGRPIAHWQFDECQGTTAYDASGNGFNGTISIGGTGDNTSAGSCTGSSGEAWFAGTTGKINYSLDLDGTDDYVNMSDPSSGLLDLGTGDFATSFWIKTGTNSTQIVGKRDTAYTSNGIGFNVGISGTGILTTGIGDGDSGDFVSIGVSDNAITDNNWHHVAVLYDRDSNITTYIDSVLQQAAIDISSISSTISNTGDFQIGKQTYNASQYFNGQIDDVRLYNYLLSPTQIQQIMIDGSSVRFGPSEGSP